MQYELGILGAGNMAEAIARAAIAKGVLSAQQIVASDPSEARRLVFSALGITAIPDNGPVIGQSKQVLLAVKPQVMRQAAADIAAHGRDDQVVISIMAGVSTAKLAAAIGRPSSRPTRIVRVMPNTPLLVGAGMAGVALGQHAQPGDETLTMRLFGAGGRVVVVDEASIDAVTAVSGSGPAYVFYLAEAMHLAAVELGLAENADLFVRQTIYGAAKLLLESSDSPAQLRRKVTSPGGTTEAAIRHMDQAQVSQALVEAIKAAHHRSKQLGEM